MCVCVCGGTVLKFPFVCVCVVGVVSSFHLYTRVCLCISCRRHSWACVCMFYLPLSCCWCRLRSSGSWLLRGKDLEGGVCVCLCIHGRVCFCVSVCSCIFMQAGGVCVYLCVCVRTFVCVCCVHMYLQYCVCVLTVAYICVLERSGVGVCVRVCALCVCVCVCVCVRVS